jgi:hypothetical protein
MIAGTYLDVNAAALEAGQDPRGLVMSFFKHSDRITIRDIQVATEAEFGAGCDWMDCLVESRLSTRMGERCEDPDRSIYHFRRAIDFIQLAISRRYRHGA